MFLFRGFQTLRLTFLSLFLASSGSIWATETSATRPQVMACMSAAEGGFRYRGSYNLEHPNWQLFNEIIDKRNPQALLIIQYLAQHPLLADLKLQELYDGSAGVTENFSLSVHTQMVIGVLREQLRFLKLGNFKTKLDIGNLLLFTMAIHDLGKSLSVTDWSEKNEDRQPRERHEFSEASRRQGIFTLPLVREIMQRLGFSEEQQKLVISLIDNDLIGAAVTYNPHSTPVRGKAPQEVIPLLKKKAEESGLEFQDYARLKVFYYISDAASYPALRYGRNFGDRWQPAVFTETAEGELFPISKSFEEFMKLSGLW